MKCLTEKNIKDHHRCNIKRQARKASSKSILQKTN